MHDCRRVETVATCVRADVLKMTIWQTPAGIVDEGGVVLPSWLNFGVTLLGPPANGIMHVSAPIHLISPCTFMQACNK